MNLKCIILVCLTFFHITSSRPQDKTLSLGTEVQPEAKIREKRKYEIPLFRQLEESGVGVIKNLDQEQTRDRSKTAVRETSKESIPTEVKDTEKISSTDHPPTVDQATSRVKKQTLNNIGGCGKTVCGPVVSARGSVVSDMTSLLQGGKPIMNMGDLSPPAMNQINEASSKAGKFSPVQGRTIDTLMGVAPLSLGSLGGIGYGTPAVFSATGSPTVTADSNTLGYGHSFFKPPTIPAIPAVAIVSQHPSHSLLHPWIMPHLMPHIMPHLMPSIGSFFTPHRFEGQRLPEVIQSDVKQPVPVFSQPSYVNAENTLVCQPYRGQRLDNPYEYIYKPDLPIDKSLNVSETSKNVPGGMYVSDEEKKIHEHLRKVNEIKEEISQLNRAAQRIVDQQEKLTEMQQKQFLGNSGSTSAHGMDQISNSYMGSGYYTHPGIPWGYSRSNILSYPNSHDDIDFFMNLLRMAKRMGLVSDSFQSSASTTAGEIAKGLQEPSKTQKEGTDALTEGSERMTNKTS